MMASAPRPTSEEAVDVTRGPKTTSRDGPGGASELWVSEGASPCAQFALEQLGEPCQEIGRRRAVCIQRLRNRPHIECEGRASRLEKTIAMSDCSKESRIHAICQEARGGIICYTT